MYKKVDTSLNFLEREKEVIEFWRKNDVFALVIVMRQMLKAEEFKNMALEISHALKNLELNISTTEAAGVNTINLVTTYPDDTQDSDTITKLYKF